MYKSGRVIILSFFFFCLCFLNIRQACAGLPVFIPHSVSGILSFSKADIFYHAAFIIYKLKTNKVKEKPNSVIILPIFDLTQLFAALIISA